MKRWLIAVCAVLVAGGAWADSKNDELAIARELGQIVASTDVCGYKLDPEKVAQIVATKVSSMSVDARQTYELGASARRYRLSKMGETERLAACAIQARLAESYGFRD